MSFLAFPLLIGGLAATSIPVVLHLIMRGIPKKYEFPALRFIQKKLKVNERKFKLKHLILLLLRIFAFVLFGLALARPSIDLSDWFTGSEGTFVSQLGSQEAPIAVVFLFDTSPRMDYVIGNETRLEAAQKFAQELMNQVPLDSEIGVFSGSRTGNEGYQVDSLAALDRISNLGTSASAVPIAELIPEAIRTLRESEHAEKELYIITDLTEPGWPQELNSTIRLALDELRSETVKPLGICIADIGALNPKNTSISSVRLSGQVLSAQTPLRIDVEMSHIGEAEERIAELVLINSPGTNEKTTRRGSEIVNFQDGRSMRNISFPMMGFSTGTYQGKVRFTATDSLPGDDEAYFTFEVQPAWKILIVAEEPIAKNAYFLRQALDPIQFRRSGSSPFDSTLMNYQGLEKLTPEAMTKYRAIMLLDPPGLHSSVWNRLTDYASTGHGVGVFLGRNVSKGHGLDSFNHAPGSELLGGKLGVQARKPDGVWIAPDDYNTPVLSVFRELGITEDVPWEALPIFRYWTLKDLNPNAYVPMKFTDARPVILVQSLGSGYTLTMSTPVSDDPNDSPWNLLPVGDGSEASWAFVALCDGIGRLLVGAGDRSYNFYPGQTAIVRPDEDRLPDNCVLMLPNDETMRISSDPDRKTISFSGTDKVGNYRIRSGGEALTVDSGFSVNFRANDMNLARIEPVKLDEIFGEGKYQLVRKSSELKLAALRGKTGTELFPLIVFVLCLFFACEYVFSNRFYGPKDVM